MARNSRLVLFVIGLIAPLMLLLPMADAADSKAVAQFNRLVLKRSYKKSASVLKAPARAGDAEAQIRLGSLYRIGVGVPRDEALARDFLRRAAASGNAKALRLLRRLNVPSIRRTEPIVRQTNSEIAVFVPPVKAADKDKSGNSWTVRAAARGRIDALPKLASTADELRLSLLSAADLGQAEAVLFLVRAGAPVNSADARGRTALMLSVSSGAPGLVESLLAAGADSALRDVNGETALHYAVRKCNAGAALALLKNEGQIADAREGSGVLRLALQYCADTSVINALMSRADLDAADANGRTALWYAASLGQDRIVAGLLEKQAKVSAIDVDGMTPLHVAALRCHADAMQALLQNGAEVDAATRQGDTPLMLAASINCIAGLRLLIAAGATLEAVNDQGDTALMIATATAGIDAVKHLIAAGAAPDVRNVRRETPLTLAERLGRGDIVALLQSP